MKGEEKKLHELFSRAREGDETACGDVYRMYFTPVYRYLFIRLGGRREEAEDIAQDSFVKILGSIHRFEYRGKDPLAYCFTIARRTLIDRIRRRRETIFSDLGDSEKPFDVTDTRGNFSKVEEDMIMENVIQVMKELSESEQEAISLRFFGERSTKEIAGLMGKSEDAVRQLQSRGLRILAKKLKNRHE